MRRGDAAIISSSRVFIDQKFFCTNKKNGGVSFSSVPFSPRLKSDNRIFYLRKSFFFLSLVFDQKKLKELLAESWETKWKGPFCGQRLKDLMRKKNLISDFFFMSLFVDEKLEKIQYLFRRRKSQYLAPTTFKQFPPRTRIFLLDDQSNYKVFFTTYSQTALLYLWQIALLGFFLPPYAAAWSERELAYLWACFIPMTVELHQTGTFEGLSTNWATAPQLYNFKVEPCW